MSETVKSVTKNQPGATTTLPGNYAKRRIDVSVALGTGNFGGGKSNTITVTGLRVQVVANSVQGEGVPTDATVTIFGLARKMMNQLATLGIADTKATGRQNTITIKAGDDVNGMSEVITGTIVSALQDYNGMPNTLMVFQIAPNYEKQLKPVQPTSYQGAVQAETILQALAGTLGLTFENHGVKATLTDTYLPGSAIMQAQTVARAAGINMVLQNGLMAIYPRDGNRGGTVIKVSAKTGMIGYPVYGPLGLICKMLYNPLVSGAVGMQAEVDSDIAEGTQKGTVAQVTHILESETPGGQWMTQFLVNLDGRPSA